jgi:hypothetical protein
MVDEEGGCAQGLRSCAGSMISTTCGHDVSMQEHEVLHRGCMRSSIRCQLVVSRRAYKVAGQVAAISVPKPVIAANCHIVTRYCK